MFLKSEAPFEFLSGVFLFQNLGFEVYQFRFPKFHGNFNGIAAVFTILNILLPGHR